MERQVFFRQEREKRSRSFVDRRGFSPHMAEKDAAAPPNKSLELPPIKSTASANRDSALRYEKETKLSNRFLRRHYPDQVQGIGKSVIFLHLSRDCTQHPCIQFALRSKKYFIPL